MVLCKLVRRNYGRKSLVSIKYQNLHSFKERLILLCQSILETRRITHLHGSALFTIPLSHMTNPVKGSIHFLLHKIDKKSYIHEQQRSRFEFSLSTKLLLSGLQQKL